MEQVLENMYRPGSTTEIVNQVNEWFAKIPHENYLLMGQFLWLTNEEDATAFIMLFGGRRVSSSDIGL